MSDSIGAAAASHPCRLRLFPGDAAPSTPPRLWFAILTYNALAYTKRCLLSLDLHTDQPWHAVILDNGSIDGTREWLSALDDPRVTTALGTENRGVAGGRNRLLELIGDRVPEDGFVVFIDNDLEFFPGWLPPFLDLFKQDPSAGIASGSGFEIVVHATHRELLSSLAFVPMLVDVASGGFACFVRPAVFRAIGGYDEQLNPFWHEDDDITVRTRAAGWNAYSVPSTAIVHHGHKSGAAVPARAHLGSRDKQEYLVRKWRAEGLVLSDGRLRYEQASDHDALGEALARRMHRPSPVSRSESARARVDIAQLAQCMAQHGTIAPRQRFASAPALALLAELTESEPGNTTWSALHAAVQSVRDTRRRQTRLPQRDTSVNSLCKLADVADWNDDRWYASALQYADDGRGRLQWYDRTAAVWEATQAAVALERHNLLGPTAQVIVFADLRRAIVWNIAATVQLLIVADFLEQYGATSGSAWLQNPEQFALNPLAANRVRAVAVDALAADVAPIGATMGVLLPWSDDMSIAEYASLLTLMCRHLQPGAPVFTTIPVRLAGPPDARVLDSPTRLPQWLATIGLELIDPLELGFSDDGLLAATDPESRSTRTPNLLVADGPRLTGRLFVAARVSE
ncbi:MAG: glycosyltransferase [Gemmatimonas sp.]